MGEGRERQQAHASVEEPRDQQIQRAKMSIVYIAAISATVVGVLTYFGVR